MRQHYLPFIGMRKTELWLPWWNACGFLGIPPQDQWGMGVFQSLHLTFKVSLETLLLKMCNTYFQWSSFFSVYQFTGLKCSLESCPGLYLQKLFNDTWQVHCFQNQFKTPAEAVQAGSPLPAALDQCQKCREGAGRCLPTSQQKPTLTGSQPQLRGKQAYF